VIQIVFKFLILGKYFFVTALGACVIASARHFRFKKTSTIKWFIIASHYLLCVSVGIEFSNLVALIIIHHFGYKCVLFFLVLLFLHSFNRHF
jgi:hypothetical protein